MARKRGGGGRTRGKGPRKDPTPDLITPETLLEAPIASPLALSMRAVDACRWELVNARARLHVMQVVFSEGFHTLDELEAQERKIQVLENKLARIQKKRVGVKKALRPTDSAKKLLLAIRGADLLTTDPEEACELPTVPLVTGP